MRQLRAASEADVIDVREVILEADPGADGKDRLEDSGEDCAVSVVFGRIVRRQERAAVEEQAAGPFAAAHDGDRIGAVPELGPHLCQVFGACLDVFARGREGKRERCRIEPPAPFVGVALAGEVDFLRGPSRIRARCEKGMRSTS